MKQLILTLITVLFLCAAANAQEARIASKIDGSAWGFGLIFGEPWVGWSIKYWHSRDLAFDAAIGIDYNNLHIHADALWHKSLFKIEAGEMPLYFGGGIMMEAGSNPGFGPRGVVGFDWLIPGAPIDIFLENAPTIDFLDPWVGDLFVNFALGFRFYL